MFEEHPMFCGCAACMETNQPLNEDESYNDSPEATTSDGSDSDAASATSDDFIVDALIGDDWQRWNFDDSAADYGLGTGVSLTYSFLNEIPTYYSEDADEANNFSQFNLQQEEKTRDILQGISSFANIEFTEMSDGIGDITYGNASLGSGIGAWAYRANGLGSDKSGDVWINNDYSSNEIPTEGNYAFVLLIHEIGHALGLTHPGDYNLSQGSGESYLPDGQENRQYTVMSYTKHPDMGNAEAQSMMLYDIAALQHLYGANMSHAIGDNIYDFSTADKLIETIWDAGGYDTISIAGAAFNAEIDLREGGFSSLGTNGGSYAVNNIAIAFGAQIEAAIGGAGDDVIVGNDVDNHIYGGLGADILTGGLGSDLFAFQSGWGADVVTDFEDGVDLLDLSETGLSFSDLSITDEAGGARITAGGFTIDLSGVQASMIDAFDLLLSATEQENLFNISSVNDVDDDANMVIEGAASGTAVGVTAFAVDSDATNNAVSYALSADSSNGGFQIDAMTGVVSVSDGAKFDFETAQQHTVTIAATSEDGSSASKTFAIEITDVNEMNISPVNDVDDDANMVIEGAASGTAVGVTAFAVDSDATNNAVSYALSADSSNGGFQIDATTGVVSVADGAKLDFETAQQHTVAIVATSEDGSSASKTFAIEISDVNEIIFGTINADVIIGTSNSDWINSLEGSDTVDGGDGDDKIVSGAGDDLVDGGSGFDSVDFSSSKGKVVVNLATKIARDGEGGRDKLLSIEQVNGSSFDDRLTGDANDNVLIGHGGNDKIVGAGGNDTISGGNGRDWMHGGAGSDLVDFSLEQQGVIANLKFETALDGFRSRDTLIGFENISGSDFDDRITANRQNNEMDGGAGNDWLSAGAGNDLVVGGAGDDVMVGGGGVDTADYSSSMGAVDVHLLAGVGHDGMGGVDTLRGFENAIGTGNDDSLTGTTQNNLLVGGAGADVLDGGAGNDHLEGGAGADILIGGGGIADLASYANDSQGVTVDVGAQQAIDGGGDVDSFVEIDGAIGSDFNDILIGDAWVNRLFGGDGDDLIIGGARGDVLSGGAGSDTFRLANNFDYEKIIDFEVGVDHLDFSQNADINNLADIEIISIFGGNSTRITNNSDLSDFILLVGVSTEYVSSDDFIF